MAHLRAMVLANLLPDYAMQGTWPVQSCGWNTKCLRLPWCFSKFLFRRGRIA